MVSPQVRHTTVNTPATFRRKDFAIHVGFQCTDAPITDISRFNGEPSWVQAAMKDFRQTCLGVESSSHKHLSKEISAAPGLSESVLLRH